MLFFFFSNLTDTTSINEYGQLKQIGQIVLFSFCCCLFFAAASFA